MDDINKILDQKAQEIKNGSGQYIAPDNNTDDIPEEFEVNGVQYNKNQINQVEDALMIGAIESNTEAKKIAENLNKKAEEGDIPTIIGRGGDENTDPVEELLNQLEEDKKKEDLGVSATDDIETMLEKLEAEKVFADVIHSEEKVGPADYIVVQNDEYINNIVEQCELNNIKLINKSGNERNAILDRFTNAGAEVSMVLVNSGIFIKSSGAGPSEIIAMNQIRGDSPALVELSKLDHVAQHITGSSVGRITLGKLIQIVSYYDKDSLYYALYAATHPNTAEIERPCEKCGRDFFMNVHTSDLLINAEYFTTRADYIKHNVETLNDLIKTSDLGKIHMQKHSSGMTIYYIHPSISDYIKTVKLLKPEIINKYPHIVDMVYSIQKLAIPDGNGNYIPYTDPNEIVVILSKLKNTDEKYEIFDMIQEIRPSVVPIYGYKEVKCPHCGNMNPKVPFQMEQLLFMIAQREEEMGALRWTARTQKKSKKK